MPMPNKIPAHPARSLKASTKTAIACVAIGLLLLIATALYARYSYKRLPHQLPSRSVQDVTTVQDWMTIHYIARTYAVPETLLIDTLHISVQQASHQNLVAIAHAQNKTPQQIETSIQAAIIQYRSLP